MRTVVGLVFLLFPAVSFSAPVKCSRDVTQLQGQVSKISDGDTIQIKNQTGAYTIRLLGIDTPELHFQGHSQGEWAEKATQELERKIPIGTKVDVVFDREPCDNYGRHLGYVMKGTVDINAEQIESGVAVNYCIYPNLQKCQEYALRMERVIEKGDSFVSEIQLPYEFRWESSGRGAEKPVADIRGTDVFDPARYTSIPIPFRLFFMDWSSVAPPYRRAQ